MSRSTDFRHERDDRMATKKNKQAENAPVYTPAKTEDVMKAITKSNEKHVEMMERLSK